MAVEQPVWIARAERAGECPDIDVVGDLRRRTLDDRAGDVGRRRSSVLYSFQLLSLGEEYWRKPAG